MRKINIGTAYPLGSSETERGVNFSVAAPAATELELLLFEEENDINPSEVIKFSHENKSGDYWHIEIEGLSIGCFYAYRLNDHGEIGENSSICKKVLLDPCARSIVGWDIFQRNSSNNKNAYLKAVVTERKCFNFHDHPRPRHRWNKTIIYELHVGGFTKSPASGLSDEQKGTFIGLIEKIPYLKDLGITAIELLPIFSFDPSDSPFGLENYWGYSPLNWFTPHHNYISKGTPLSARDQFRKLVEACHDNDIELILDVVFNHTTEGDQNGPIISWKGFGESVYYHKNEQGEFLDVSGCGNTVAANHPLVRQLILESMRCWSYELGVDGFRFDLGVALSRGKDLAPLDSPPIFEEIESDPLLSELKLISEPWDCGGLYRLSDFPAKRISTWNGHFRDDLRRFWKGDKNSTWPLKDRLLGSPLLYKDNANSVAKSINFITSHDGFTLIDLLSFNKKHNLSNGENNRDGENHNNSWNHGVEGPSTKESLNNVRKRQQRNLLSSLLLSPGIPMLLMGDEVGRSQGGNNNSWCQDTSLGWMIWDINNCDNELRSFLKKIIQIRKDLSGLFSPETNPFTEPSLPYTSQELWIQWHGVKVNSPDWSSWSHTISYSINQGKKGSVIWLGLNGYNQSMEFELPKSTSSWMKIIDTSLIKEKEISPTQISNQDEIQIESRSLVLIVSKDFYNPSTA